MASARILQICLFLAFVEPALGIAQAPSPVVGGTPTPQQWKADAEFLSEKLQAMHPAPFRKIDRTTFEVNVAAFDRDVSKFSREQAVVGVMRLVASLGDGHTAIPPESLRAFGFHLLPLRFYVYGDGLYLQAGDRQYQQGLGGKLVSIGEMSAADVYTKLRAVTSHDNDLTIDGRLPGFLVIPEVLAGLGVIENSAADVSVELERAGKDVRLQVKPIVAPPSESASVARVAYTSDWVDSSPADLPLWLRHADKPYWFEYLPDTKTLYVQYNQCTSDGADPMPAFADRLKAELRTRSPDRVILDLRQNSGGEGYWNKPLFLALLKSEQIDRKGKLFVLIGRDTFSAGSVLAIDFDRFSNAVFVGEPTGGAVQNFGNHDRVVLPNSGLFVMVATKYYQNDGPFDERPWIAPEIAAPLTQKAYEAGQDPALQAAIDYIPPVQVLKTALLATSANDVGRIVSRFESDQRYRYMKVEPVLTTLGYEFIQAKDFGRAIAVFLIATKENPQSANAFDSLGDAYRAADKLPAAIESYRRALEINPNWYSSRNSLRELGVEPQRQQQ
jgi:tetratricopeptide (TPR) repeat protein